jgi:hypothetical protein
VPAHEAFCSHCQRETALPAQAFADLLYAFDDHHEALAEGQSITHSREANGLPITASFRRLVKPLCEKCGAPYREERIADGESRDIFCSSCGDPASTTVVPAWLRERVPQARQIVSVDAGAAKLAAGESGSAPLPEVETEATRPIVMACPQCGGSLRITSETSRLLPCQFCRTDVYLPDAVWLRLHPARTVREWFVRFDGPTRPEIQRQREADAYAAGQAQRAIDEQARDVAVETAKRVAYRWLGALYALAAATIAFALLGLLLGISPTPGTWTFFALPLVAPQIVLGLIALVKASDVIRLRTGADSDHLMGWIGLWAIFGIFPFPFAPIVFGVALMRFAGTLGAATMVTNGRRVHIEARRLTRREGWPIGFFLLAQSVVYPLEAGLLMAHRSALACTYDQVVGPEGTCVSCGKIGDLPCPRNKGSGYCGPGLARDASTGRCAPKKS